MSRILFDAFDGATGYTIAAASGTVAITGQAATLLAPRIIAAASGSVAIAGTAATLTKHTRVVAASGTIPITGTAAGFRKKVSYGLYANPAANPAITTAGAYVADDPGHIAAYKRATQAGVDHQYEIWQPVVIEPTLGMRSWPNVDRWVDNTGLLPLMINIATVDSDGAKHLPAELMAEPWDGSAIAAWVVAFVNELATHLDGRAVMVTFGNEANFYFDSNPSQIAPYGTFLATAKAAVHAAMGDHVKVSCNFAFDAVADWGDYDGDIGAVLDWHSFTYYPINSDFTIQNPRDIGADFSALATAIGGAPFVIQEIGIPTSATLGSSEAEQVEFMDEVFFIADVYGDAGVLFALTWTWEYDLSPAVVADTGAVGNHAQFIGTLGVRDAGTGPKEAWPVLVAYLHGDAGDYILSCASGAVAITGTAATLRRGVSMPAASGSVAITGTAATVRYARVVPLASGSVTISGTAATFRKSTVLALASGTVTIAGTAATLRRTTSVTLASGTVAIAGTALTFRYSRVVPMTAGSVAIVGTAATFLKSIVLASASGAIAIVGTAATFRRNTVVTLAAGTVTVTGTAATLKYNRAVVGASGAVAIAGGATTFRIGYRISAAGGAVAIVGGEAALQTGAFLFGESGTIAISGTAAFLRYNRRPAFQGVTVALVGQAAGLSWHRVAAFAGGVLAVTGTAAELRLTRALALGSSTIDVVGVAASLARSRGIVADVGVVEIVGGALQIIATQHRPTGMFQGGTVQAGGPSINGGPRIGGPGVELPTSGGPRVTY